MLYYSAITGGFYSRDVHGDAIPHDAVGITTDEHTSLLAGQAAGQRIVPGADGRPMLADKSAPTEAALAAQVRAQRDRALDDCEWMVTRHRDQTDAGGATTLTAAEYQELLAYRQALRDITAQAGWPGSITWPSKPEWMPEA
ncbi:phage tail assembly chaperone [Desulfovibrio sp. UIB00]|uniref:phage tail assembly chaperone n=1 Tax=Desulfovibrio sp. UIB00 TaxID=2804314 RepID=UPI001F0E0239|nr:phage tail assembly chaperone [Desulfovibrio sp. UIB00]MCH5146366.1 phage tail assembly chaperone [Desulfovibrio sp. UIB00]